MRWRRRERLLAATGLTERGVRVDVIEREPVSRASARSCADFVSRTSVANYAFDGTETLTLGGMDHIAVGMNELAMQMAARTGRAA